ncbi:hypothetical protein CLV94_2034 [Flavobacterium endophyticum]|uniref:Uncharacterized protein n=1 Tax=Flavobacterium endophyticum TaxID=1540163 RepID=A0A495MCQ8_9FLAO|nr:hypothetical protein CLV94_2034 [Flavobacterium endophyticum]
MFEGFVRNEFSFETFLRKSFKFFEDSTFGSVVVHKKRRIFDFTENPLIYFNSIYYNLIICIALLASFVFRKILLRDGL